MFIVREIDYRLVLIMNIFFFVGKFFNDMIDLCIRLDICTV